MKYESFQKKKRGDAGMPKHEIENHIDFLLSAALNKCKNLEDAQDLTQDTLLAALTYLSKGNAIHDIKGWLLTVLNRKFYYKLRQKYKIPVVSIGSETDITDIIDIIDETNPIDDILKTDEIESLRRSIAYLSKLHREVIVRHYMNGERIEKIARELGVPQGTVKSRLSAGREKIKKELDNMENYQKQSYEPIDICVSNHGIQGMNGEPGSLVNGDLIAQNLLWLAYNQPVMEEELAKAIGIPMAYIEPIVKKLTDNELMRRVGNKVYTDFIITTVADKKKYISAQEQLVSENSDLFLRALKNGLDKIRCSDFYRRFTQNQKNALELYFMFKTQENGTFSRIFNVQHVTIPDRPNGGKWIAMGNMFPANYDWKDYIAIIKHSYAGERHTYLDNYLGAKSLSFHVYDPEGFPVKRYFSNHKNPQDRIEDDDLLKLLWVVENGANPEETGFNVELLRRVPWLVSCKILCYSGDKPAVDIPAVSPAEWASICDIIKTTQNALTEDTIELLREFYKNKKLEIPKHLTDIPLHQQYMDATGALVMMVIRRAMKDGIIHDGNYDDDSQPDNQPPYPLVFVAVKFF